MLSNVSLCPGYPRMPSGARSPIVPFPDASGALRAPLVVVDSSKLRRRMLRMPRPVVCVVENEETKACIRELVMQHLRRPTQNLCNKYLGLISLRGLRPEGGLRSNAFKVD